MNSVLRPLAVIFLLMSSLTAVAQEEGEGKVDKEVKELSGISIIGNKEAPKSLYIVPWKSSEVGVENGLNSSLLDPSLQPLDKEVFSRELEFYQLSLTDD
ncbi:hypothetical protein [Microbulbifer agarilyticus]|uniref:hypothetical protein n=1 Tax=Microbulbifer agarilyticus TaxID=260552 RepID=UPI001C95AACC|nr:hypothetical protein [Microbulbifer agarilyticus]MBY6190445.1 hypothetical protein [Microbulbifer agarilyticus]MBY6210441.1 hypothetical protein [Microbulbifer agarilyticus]MCA0892931.1 hypothetical protein [Microbulbifer agarilyticus]